MIYSAIPAEPQMLTKVASREDKLQDDVKPSDSVSNVESRVIGIESSVTGSKSSASSTASAHLKAETDLAALMARQK